MSPDMQVAPASQTHTESTVLEIPELLPVSPLSRNDKIEHCFAAKSWHLPYAEALIEEVLPFLPIAITLAERAILNRYFELHGIAGASEERRDLWRAVEELQKLKKNSAKTVYQTEHQSA